MLRVYDLLGLQILACALRRLGHYAGARDPRPFVAGIERAPRLPFLTVFWTCLLNEALNEKHHKARPGKEAVGCGGDIARFHLRTPSPDSPVISPHQSSPSSPPYFASSPSSPPCSITILSHHRPAQTSSVDRWPKSFKETFSNERGGLSLARASQSGTRPSWVCQDGNKILCNSHALSSTRSETLTHRTA